MPTISLSRDDVSAIHTFVVTNNCKNWFVAKDDGAYVGASIGKGQNVIRYFPGCDPKKNANWFDKVQRDFGGDDFGEHLDVKLLNEFMANPHAETMKLSVGKTKMTVSVICRTPPVTNPMTPETMADNIKIADREGRVYTVVKQIAPDAWHIKRDADGKLFRLPINLLKAMTHAAH